jgi:hypothetical protein
MQGFKVELLFLRVIREQSKKDRLTDPAIAESTP